MAKFYGKIGFGVEREVSPGVYDYDIVEKPYFGEVVRDAYDSVGGTTVLGERKTANAFRIVGDGYSVDHFYDMKYIRWAGRYWEIRQVEVVSRPRMLIRIGGVWNGPTAETQAPVTPGDDSGE